MGCPTVGDMDSDGGKRKPAERKEPEGDHLAPRVAPPGSFPGPASVQADEGIVAMHVAMMFATAAPIPKPIVAMTMVPRLMVVVMAETLMHRASRAMSGFRPAGITGRGISRNVFTRRA